MDVNEKGLTSAVDALDGLARSGDDVAGEPGTETWETTNLLTVATALAGAALLREETRGTHWRDDHPDADDAWRGHLETTLGDDGTLSNGFVRVTA